MTLQQIAAEINKLFRRYGLDHDVVEVDEMGFVDRLRFVDSTDTDAMELLLTTFTELFQGYFEEHPETAQMRLF
jgi:hypothetical protein